MELICGYVCKIDETIDFKIFNNSFQLTLRRGGVYFVVAIITNKYQCFGRNECSETKLCSSFAILFAFLEKIIVLGAAGGIWGYIIFLPIGSTEALSASFPDIILTKISHFNLLLEMEYRNPEGGGYSLTFNTGVHATIWV